MTPDDIKAICVQRLGSWTSRLVGEHATPVVLVAVGHDHARGKLVILTTEEMGQDEIIAFLAGALQALARGRSTNY